MTLMLAKAVLFSDTLGFTLLSASDTVVRTRDLLEGGSLGRVVMWEKKEEVSEHVFFALTFICLWTTLFDSILLP